MRPSVSIRLLLTQSDARLATLAGDGHERAFEALVRRYRGPLLRYCRRLLLCDERAEDVVQQAFLHAWLALRREAEVRNVRAWLYSIVHNTALNALRLSGYDYSTLSDTLSGAEAPQADLDRRIAVREALAGLAALPDLQREALLRTAVQGCSHHEVARDLGVSESTLRGLVYRARLTLRAVATALTPPPVLSWAVSYASGGAPVGERLVEAGAGGSAGMAGLLLKGGTIAVTASALAGGLGAIQGHRHMPSRRSASPRASTAQLDTPTRVASVSLSSGEEPLPPTGEPSPPRGRTTPLPLAAHARNIRPSATPPSRPSNGARSLARLPVHEPALGQQRNAPWPRTNAAPMGPEASGGSSSETDRTSATRMGERHEDWPGGEAFGGGLTAGGGDHEGDGEHSPESSLAGRSERSEYSQGEGSATDQGASHQEGHLDSSAETAEASGSGVSAGESAGGTSATGKLSSSDTEAP